MFVEPKSLRVRHHVNAVSILLVETVGTLQYSSFVGSVTSLKQKTNLDLGRSPDKQNDNDAVSTMQFATVDTGRARTVERTPPSRNCVTDDDPDISIRVYECAIFMNSPMFVG